MGSNTLKHAEACQNRHTQVNEIESHLGKPETNFSEFIRNLTMATSTVIISSKIKTALETGATKAIADLGHANDSAGVKIKSEIGEAASEFGSSGAAMCSSIDEAANRIQGAVKDLVLENQGMDRRMEELKRIKDDTNAAVGKLASENEGLDRRMEELKRIKDDTDAAAEVLRTERETMQTVTQTMNEANNSLVTTVDKVNSLAEEFAKQTSSSATSTCELIVASLSPNKTIESIGVAVGDGVKQLNDAVSTATQGTVQYIAASLDASGTVRTITETMSTQSTAVCSEIITAMNTTGAVSSIKTAFVEGVQSTNTAVETGFRMMTDSVASAMNADKTVHAISDAMCAQSKAVCDEVTTAMSNTATVTGIHAAFEEGINNTNTALQTGVQMAKDGIATAMDATDTVNGIKSISRCRLTRYIAHPSSFGNGPYRDSVD